MNALLLEGEIVSTLEVPHALRGARAALGSAILGGDDLRTSDVRTPEDAKRF